MECLEYICATEEAAQQWGVEEQLIKESYGELVEYRSIDSVNEILQVLAIAFEVKLGERREDKTPWRQRQASVLSIIYRSRESEFEEKLLEPGQCGQVSGHCIRENVSGVRNI